MKRMTVMIVVLAVLGGAVASAPAALDEEIGAAKTASFTDDMERLKETVSLKQEQETKLGKMRQLRDQALAKWDESSEKAIRALEDKRSKAKGKNARRVRREIDAQLKRVHRQRARLAGQHERQMFAVLTPKQRSAWNVPLLRDAVQNEFRSCALTSKQDEQIVKLCEMESAKLTMPVAPDGGGKLIQQLKAQVRRNVLTVKQRQEYDKLNRQEKPRQQKDKTGRQTRAKKK